MVINRKSVRISMEDKIKTILDKWETLSFWKTEMGTRTNQYVIEIKWQKHFWRMLARLMWNVYNKHK